MNKFCVLMSVYIKEQAPFLDDALYSIWDRQTLKPAQVVLVKDGPLNLDLDNVIECWKKKLSTTLTVVTLEKNSGLAVALNEGLLHCNQDLVARMDSDDISLPNRFSLQVEYMDKNPDISVSSGQVIEYDLRMKNILGKRTLPINHNELLKMSTTRNPLSHPASIFRKSKVISVGGYPLFLNSQDWALWSLMLSKGCHIANISDDIVNMRTDTALLNRRGFKYYRNEVKLFLFQKDKGLYGWKIFFYNVLSKGVLRLSPIFVKEFLYKNFR